MTICNEYLGELHKEVREELVRVDAKIGVLLRGFMVTLAVAAAGVVAGEWRPAELGGPGQKIWWVGAALTVASTGRLATATTPRTMHTKPPLGLPRYFRDIAALESAQDLLTRIEGASSDERRADQTYELAKLVVAKIPGDHTGCVGVWGRAGGGCTGRGDRLTGV